MRKDQTISECELRAVDERSLSAFFRVYQPILRKQARLLRVDRGGDIDTFITEFLDTMAIELMNKRALPANLSAYVASAFRHHAVRADRAKKTRRNFERENRDELTHTIGGPGLDPPRAILELCSLALAELNDNELQLISYIGNHVPTREIASWLNIERSAAKVRVHRLKKKLRSMMPELAGSLSSADRRQVEMILGRAGVSRPGRPTVEQR